MSAIFIQSRDGCASDMNLPSSFTIHSIKYQSSIFYQILQCYCNTNHITIKILKLLILTIAQHILNIGYKRDTNVYSMLCSVIVKKNRYRKDARHTEMEKYKVKQRESCQFSRVFLKLLSCRYQRPQGVINDLHI